MVVRGSPQLHKRRAQLLFSAGAIGGLSVAALSFMTPPQTSALDLREGTAALVNGIAIRTADIDAVLAAHPDGSGSHLERDAVLNNLIDQELLFQQARALEVDRHDRIVRNMLVGAVRQSIVTEGASADVSEARR